MVNRLHVEKRPGLSPEVEKLKSDLVDFLGIDSVDNVRIINRYDVEDLNPEVFDIAKSVVFSEPQVDIIHGEEFPLPETTHRTLAVETLPGQFDQRADSCSQCIQLLAGVERPPVSYAKIYIFEGDVSDDELSRISNYLINPVEAREASFEKPETLRQKLTIPTEVDTVEGFISMSEDELKNLREELGLAMDLDDTKFLQDYFKNDEKRNPTITEVRVIDTYWSDHCRHLTFGTHLDSVEIDNPEVKEAYDNYLKIRDEVYGKDSDRPITLMDLATIGAKVLKKRGQLPNLDESEEINACSFNVKANVNGEDQDWVVMFKNETHNHPTEIEPFGGAATCIGGCIRDPLSGRAYVYQAMRVTGGADPRVSFNETIEGKLPQRQIAQTAAQGYSSYGNQIGLATGHVAELYHPGYAAKHLECGAVVGAAPKSNIVREVPEPGDIIILLGGRTGRDGIGGATGSSKRHDMKSLTTMASEVQKGNPPEERKIQRLFRNPEITRLIKRCNDFGAGGVSVAIGELADGLEINLDKVRKKYEGLDGTELAISESQERMAVVVDKDDVETFIEAANKENLEAYPVAIVTENPRMKMTWNGEVVCDLSREFLNSNGAVKHADVLVEESTVDNEEVIPTLEDIAGSLKAASRRGLVERFDSTIGAGSVMLPFGGLRQRTPEQVMAALLPVLPGEETDQATIMAYGFDPDWVPEWDNSTVNPFENAQMSVTNSLAKIVAGGADYKEAYLSLQEFFERLGDDPLRWGKPLQALLGALEAQLDYNVAAIGGKDSMSGTFMDLDVPPTLISFAIAPIKADEVTSSAFYQADKPVYAFALDDNVENIKKSWESLNRLNKEEKVLAARAVETGGIAEAIIQMSFGNNVGFSSIDTPSDISWYKPYPSAIVAELSEALTPEELKEFGAIELGKTNDTATIEIGNDNAEVDKLLQLNEAVLENVYPIRVEVEETYAS